MSFWCPFSYPAVSFAALDLLRRKSVNLFILSWDFSEREMPVNVNLLYDVENNETKISKKLFIQTLNCCETASFYFCFIFRKSLEK